VSGIRKTKLEKIIEEDHIERKIKTMFDCHKWKPSFKNEFYLIESAKIKSAKIKDWNKFREDLK
jgi:hypothetical protein